MKKIEIKGKEYVPVNERIIEFRKDHPNWIIETDIVDFDRLKDGFCLMRTEIRDEERHLISSAHAYEKESSSFINKTSFIENCETSAVGRALGFLGYGVDTSIASFEEVANAINNQGKEENPKKRQYTRRAKKPTKVEQVKPITSLQMKSMKMAVEENLISKEDLSKLIRAKGKTKAQELTEEEAHGITNIINALVDAEENFTEMKFEGEEDVED